MSLDSIKTSLGHAFGLDRAEPKVPTAKADGTATLRAASSFADVAVRQGGGENRPASTSSWKTEISSFFKGILADAKKLKASVSRDFAAFKADPKGFVASLFGGSSAEAKQQAAVNRIVAGHRIDGTRCLSSALEGLAKGGPQAGAGILDKTIANFLATGDRAALPDKIANAVFGELVRADSYDDAKKLVAEFRALARDFDAAAPTADTRAMVLAAIDAAEVETTTLAGATTQLNANFDKEFAKQAESPGTFFRGAEATNVSLQNVLKNDSPAFIAKMESAYQNALTKLDAHPLVGAARSDADARNTAPGTGSPTLDEASGLPVKQEIALQLATELFAEIFGTDDAGKSDFATLLGTDTKAFLKRADTAIRHEATTNPDMGAALNKWNSNNLILRGGGKVNSELKAELGREGRKFEADVMSAVHNILTTAAGGVTGVGKSETEYRADPRYLAFIPTVTGTLSDITRNHLG